MPIILKIILGTGARGLVTYISQFSKASAHHPQNDPKIYDRIHLTDVNWRPLRGSKPAASLDFVPRLHQLNVVHNPRPADTGRRDRKSNSELLLPRDAFDDLDGGPADDAKQLRWAGHRPGSAANEKPARPRGGGLLTPSAPPTFSNFAGTTPRQIAAEFGALRKLKPNLGKAVGHLILSPGPQDRVLSKKEWKKALEIALAEHGASNAPYAAWLHDDTDHQHLHVFFSRILPTGQVISDSHSYQKNRFASRKIEQELQLIPFTDTPNPSAPGDRKVLANATRSSERRGEELTTAAELREAVMTSARQSDLPDRLASTGNECKFVKRGKDDETYGILVRKIGTDQWIKASSLAKDLSWPKIKHRFLDSDRSVVTDSAEQILETQQPEKVQQQEQQQRAARSDLDRMPGVTRSVLTGSALIKRAAEAEDDSETGLGGISKRLGRLSMELQGASPLIKTGLLCAQLGVLCAELSLAAMKALIAFVIRLLRSFGLAIRLTTAEVTTPSAPLQLSPADESAQNAVPMEVYRLGDVSARAPDVDTVAAASLGHVLNCVQTGQFDALPEIGDGSERAALVSALTEDGKAASGADGAGAASAPGAAPDPFEPLFSSIAAYTAARQARDAAEKVESVEVRDARLRVGQANQSLLKAQTRFQREHPRLFSLGLMKKNTQPERAAVAAAEDALEQTKIDYPPAPPIFLVRDANEKGTTFLSLARTAVRHLEDQLPLIADPKTAKFAALSIARFQTSIAEFKGGRGEEVISVMAHRAAGELKKFIEDDLLKSRTADVNARLAAAAEVMRVAAADDEAPGADGDDEPPREPPRG